MSTPRSTVCVVPRERFGSAVDALEALLSDPEAPTRIAYFDGGSPPPVRDRLAALAADHDITLLRSSAYVVPNAARNHLFPHVETEFTAFLDNDVFVSPGWLPRMERTADETGAAAVAPIYGVALDELASAVVHLAGADNHLVGEPGQLHHHMDFHHEGEDPADVSSRLAGGPTEQAEFHLYFARTNAFRGVMPLDEGLSSLLEHLEVSLGILEQGGQIWLDPTVVATYLQTTRYSMADRRYHLLRWSQAWNEASVQTFCAARGADPDSPSMRTLLQHAAYARLRAYRPFRSPIGRLRGMLGQHSMPLPDHTIAPLVARYEERRRRRAPAPTVVHLASWDRAHAA